MHVDRGLAKALSGLAYGHRSDKYCTRLVSAYRRGDVFIFILVYNCKCLVFGIKTQVRTGVYSLEFKSRRFGTVTIIVLQILCGSW